MNNYNQYIGKAWSETGNGPDDYNCWNLMRAVMRNEFNINLPEAPIGDADKCRQMHQEALDANLWAIVDDPQPGDGVLLRGGDDPHVGVFVIADGKPSILQSLQGAGVVCFDLARTRLMGFGRMKFYRANQT